ncbi:hypothetical protein T552_01147 [Pneumocystis carinii B80]|uniref:FHA domain-containing protein n=1 Tax=Pneumocystis carinii (strain B80) TaxID=1408658 RepID=A0A0W4ZLK6_PNEC8|nr:hypothetical protein T552_01147 [Pneumocystis carinii B80]KTW29190.1 hypothetical protein T552_01147 [Pneumocystis carinii B80]
MPKSYTNNNKYDYHENMSFELNDQNKTKYKCSYSQKQLESSGSRSEPEKPNFGLSGKLAAESNHINGIPLKYYEPSEAHKPDKSWQLYVFKNNEQVGIFDIDQKSSYLLGRDRLVADIPLDHPSCSKQHAVIQFRQIKTKNTILEHIKPYIIDLKSTNGTFLNNERVLDSRYIELKPKDMLKFADSTREYILLHDNI